MTEKDKKKKTVSSDASKKTKTVQKPTVKKKVVVRKSGATSFATEQSKKAEVVALAKQIKPIKVSDDAIYATGRRKESTAKVWLFKGTGVVKVNHKNPLDYLSSNRLVNRLLTPLETVSLKGKYDVRIDVSGGGLTGQAEASILGLSRAILLISDDFKSALRADGLLTQDRREKERKKYGKRGARKSPQFRKR